jgi:AcrR family transcriptional regulator
METYLDRADGGGQNSDLAEQGEVVTAASFSERHREVLDVVLSLMVEAGDRFSLSRVCREASCSKETLYNWFGDRDGLLTATVQWQASKVRMPELPEGRLDREALREALASFAQSWLSVIGGDLSIALNRMAISHAGSGKSRLGEIVLTYGPDGMRRRLKPLFEAGRECGLLVFDDSGEVFHVFFGLVVADFQVRALLGEARKLDREQVGQRAAEAADRFLVLFGKNSGGSAS